MAKIYFAHLASRVTFINLTEAQENPFPVAFRFGDSYGLVHQPADQSWEQIRESGVLRVPRYFVVIGNQTVSAPQHLDLLLVFRKNTDVQYFDESDPVNSFYFRPDREHFIDRNQPAVTFAEDEESAATDGDKEPAEPSTEPAKPPKTFYHRHTLENGVLRPIIVSQNFKSSQVVNAFLHPDNDPEKVENDDDVSDESGYQLSSSDEDDGLIEQLLD